MRRWVWMAGGVVAILGVTALVAQLDDSDDHKRYRVPSGAMEPTYQVGDLVTANLDAYDDSSPKIGDVVIFNPPVGAAGLTRCGDPRTGAVERTGAACDLPVPSKSKLEFIKRIVAGPGDTLSIQNGHPVVNGIPAREDFIEPCTPGGACNLPSPITIPPDHWFILGDNRGASEDSRFWGPVPTEWIIARVDD